VRVLPIIFTVAFAFSGSILAQMQAITSDGQRVLLNDDNTWEYATQPGAADDALVMHLERAETTGKKSCKLGVRLTNNRAAEVGSIVPRFSAYIAGNVLFDSHSSDFFGIKPTQSIYREIIFPGLPCEDIAYVQVHGADRCRLGDQDKYSAQSSECLDYILIQESDLLTLVK